MPELEPRIFSFNAPQGACPRCTGLGAQPEIDPELVVPDPDLSIAQGALAPWASSNSAYYDQMTRRWPSATTSTSTRRGARSARPSSGSSSTAPAASASSALSQPLRPRAWLRRAFRGDVVNLERRYRETDSELQRERSRSS